MKKLNIILVLFGTFCVAPLAQLNIEQEHNLSMLEAIKFTATRNLALQRNTLERIVANVNKDLAALERTGTAKPENLQYAEMVQYRIDQLPSTLRQVSINFPTFGDRGEYPGILGGLRDDFAEVIEGRSANIEQRIRSALEAFEAILRSDRSFLIHPKAKYAHSYLDSLIGLIEEQLTDKGIRFYADRYTTTRQRIKTSVENGRLETEAHFGQDGTTLPYAFDAFDASDTFFGAASGPSPYPSTRPSFFGAASGPSARPSFFGSAASPRPPLRSSLFLFGAASAPSPRQPGPFDLSFGLSPQERALIEATYVRLVEEENRRTRANTQASASSSDLWVENQYLPDNEEEYMRMIANTQASTTSSLTNPYQIGTFNHLIATIVISLCG